MKQILTIGEVERLKAGILAIGKSIQGISAIYRNE